jgi:hypothetical protein
MSKNQRLHNISNISSQNARYPKALEDDYALVDDSSFEELLAYSSELSKLFKFYNLKLQHIGDWSTLFHSNEVVTISEIISYCSLQVQSSINQKNDLSLCYKAQYSYDLALKLDQWLKRLQNKENTMGVALTQIIESIIQNKVAKELHTLGFIVNQNDSAISITIDKPLEQFSEVWQLTNETDEPFALSKINKSPSSAELTLQIDNIYFSILSRFSYLKSLCSGYLVESLSSKDHEPSIGLFITFLKLYQRVQNKINQFSAKHRDYYYFKLLKVTNQKEYKDREILLIEPQKQYTEIVIEKDREFNSDRLINEPYQSISDYVVSHAEVKSLFTIYLERDRYISPEYFFNYVTRIKLNELQIALNEVKDPPKITWPLFGHKKGASFQAKDVDAGIGFAIASPSFYLEEGERKIRLNFSLKEKFNSQMEIDNWLNINAMNIAKYTSEKRSIENKVCLHQCFNSLCKSCKYQPDLSIEKMLCQMGKYAIDEFFYCVIETQRKNIVKLFLLNLLKLSQTQNDYFFAVGKIFNRHLLSFKKWLTNLDLCEIKRIHDQKSDLPLFKSVPLNDIYSFISDENEYQHFQLLDNSFKLKITTETGWSEIDNYQISIENFSENKCHFTIELSISSGEESVLSYQPEIHGDIFSTQLPLLKVSLNNSANFYAYSLFEDFHITKINIETAVKGLTSLVAYNEHGQVDTTKPFTVFGPLPKNQSYLMVGSYEPAKKNVLEYSVSVKWAGLPKDLGGFYSYYKEYGLAIDNNNFKLAKSMLKDGKWKPIDTINMFELSIETDVLLCSDIWTFYSDELATPIKESISEEEFNGYQYIRNGFYKVLLSEPEIAFGHGAYNQILATAITINSKLKVQKTLPKPPFTPAIESISINYTSTETIDFDLRHKDKCQFYHCNGKANVLAQSISKGFLPTLLPDFSQYGYLFIGFKASNLPSVLSLYFKLEDDSTLAVKGSSPTITWSIYTKNGWNILPVAKILVDSTEGLTVAGVVTIELPKNMVIDHSIAPNNLYWLRVSVNDSIEHFSSIANVVCNCIEVQRQSKSADEAKTKNWIAEKPISGVKNIQAVLQQNQNHTIAGKRQLIMATSEKLRHKNRLVTAWDYEHFILDNFPDLFLVKCFCHMNSNSVEPQPGNVLIIVIPMLKVNQNFADNINVDTTILRKIYRAIKKVSPPFINIEVRNPRYERIQIRCSVTFKNKVTAGNSCIALNKQICEYFSPYKLTGKKILFGWQLTCGEMISYIRELPTVQSITNFSILHINEITEQQYELNDTVELKEHNSSVLTSLYPWCLPIPDKNHVIEVIELPQIIAPNITGIDEMEVGNNFIVGA